MRKITALYWHYTESPDVPMSTVRAWHIARGWKREGYHGLIRKDGSFEAGRPESMVGAHVEHYNANSLGYCITGSDTLDWYPTDAQYATAARVARDIMARYGLTLEQATMFHRDSQSTSCPGRLDRERLRREITTIEEESELALTSVQGKVDKDTSWSTASYGAKNSRVYVDAINHGTVEANLRVLIQLADGNYGDSSQLKPPMKPIPPSAPKQAGFRTFEVGDLFKNGAMGNYTLRFLSDQPMTIKVTQEMV